MGSIHPRKYKLRNFSEIESSLKSFSKANILKEFERTHSKFREEMKDQISASKDAKNKDQLDALIEQYDIKNGGFLQFDNTTADKLFSNIKSKNIKKSKPKGSKRFDSIKKKYLRNFNSDYSENEQD